MEGTLVLDAQTLQLSGGAPDFDSEIVLFITSAQAGNVRSYVAPADGFIGGWVTSISVANYAISVAVAPDTSAKSSAGVYSGQVQFGTGVNPSNGVGFSDQRYRFKKNDVIYVGACTATQVILYMLLCYTR